MTAPVSSEATAMREAAGMATEIVKRTPLPFGRTSGQLWPISPLEASVVNIFGSPPCADTCQRPPEIPPPNTIVSLGPQLAPPIARPTLTMVVAGPPRTDTRFRAFSTTSMNPTCRPSGEKNGLVARSDPRSNVTSTWSDRRRYNRAVSWRCRRTRRPRAFRLATRRHPNRRRACAAEHRAVL